jgi:hypothetical protein
MAKQELDITRLPSKPRPMVAADAARTSEDCKDLLANMRLLITEIDLDRAELVDAIKVLEAKELRLEISEKEAARNAPLPDAWKPEGACELAEDI